MLRKSLMLQIVVLFFMTLSLSPQIVDAQGKFDDLLKRLPEGANALVVIDVKAVLNSPLAIKESWRDKHKSNYMKQPMILPPESDRIVLAAKMNPDRNFQQTWEAAVVSLPESLSMKSIARAEGGYLDSINNVKVVWTPSDAYFLEINKNTLGVMHPAQRQVVARWIDDNIGEQTAKLSPYLTQAASYVEGPTQIVLALDLKNVIQPHKLQEALKNSEFTKGNATKQKEWATVIQSLRGLSLKVNLGQTAQGDLRFDFGESTTPLGKDTKALLLQLLTKYGVGIDDMQQWNAKNEGYSAVLQGPLSTSGMRKIFSLLELPTTKFSTLKNVKTEPENKPTSVAQASLRYFRSVTTLMEDLRKEFKTNRDARHGYASVYMDRYGRKIDRLPILHVDKELLDFGSRVSKTLAEASAAKKMANIRGGVRKSSVYGNYQYGYNGNGYYSSRSNYSVRNQIEREEQATALRARATGYQEIEDDITAMRRKMTEKYNLEF